MKNNKKAKPILLVKMPELKKEEYDNFNKGLKKFKKDYYVIIISSEIFKTIEVEVFYEKNFNKVKYKELKKIIKNSVKNNNQKNEYLSIPEMEKTL